MKDCLSFLCFHCCSPLCQGKNDDMYKDGDGLRALLPESSTCLFAAKHCLSKNTSCLWTQHPRVCCHQNLRPSPRTFKIFRIHSHRAADCIATSTSWQHYGDQSKARLHCSVIFYPWPSMCNKVQSVVMLAHFAPSIWSSSYLSPKLLGDFWNGNEH